MRLPVICLFDKVGIRSHQLINKRTPFFGTVLIEIVFVSMSGVMRAVLGLLLISLGLSCWSLLNSLHQASSPHPDTRSSAAVAFHQTSVESSPAGIDLRGVPPRLDVDRLRLLGIESPERIRAVPIREIEVGMRVPAHNPQRSDAERAADDLGIDPATWRKFTLDVEKSDGSGIVTVTLLRPATWLVAEREATELALLELAIEHEVTELIEHWASLPYWARTWYQLHEWVSVDSWLDSVAETLVQTWSWGDRCWRVLASGDLASGFIRLGAGEWIQSVHEEIVADWEYEQSFVSAVGEVQSGAGVDSYVWVDLPELGAEGLGRVVANEACPLVLPGPGQVVTGTFVHRSADVLDLVFAPSSQFSTDSRLFPGGSLAVAGFESDRPRFQTAATTQTIGVTPVHPFWSVTRDEFVPAGELVLGEEGVTIDGQIWRLTSITPRAGPETVYNFEVAGEHVYYVTSDGLLVHNSCLGKAIKNARGFIRSQWSVVKGVVAKRFGRWLSGDHVLPLKVIKDALVRAGVSKNSKLYQEVMAFAHSPKNLRLMDRSLNSSKGALNAVRWSKTPQGSLVPRKYIQNVLRKQYKNAQELNDILNKGLGTNKDWFQGFFK